MAKRQSNKQTSSASDLKVQAKTQTISNPVETLRRDLTTLMDSVDTLAAAAIRDTTPGAWTLKSAADNLHAASNALTSYATLSQN